MVRQLATALAISAVFAQATPKDDPKAAWLGRAEAEAGAVAGLVLRAELLGKVAVGYARLDDEPGYRRALDLARRALEGVDIGPGTTPAEHAERAAAATLIGARARAGDIRGAKALAEEFLKDREPYRPSFLAPIAEAQARAGDVDGALATAAPLAGSAKGQVLAAVAAALARRGEDARARQVADSVRGDGFDGREVLEAVARAQVDAGRFVSALKTADSLPDAPARQMVYQEAAEAQARRGDIPGALATAASAPPGERPAGDDPARAMIHAAIAQIQIDSGDVAGAKATLARVEGPPKPVMLREVALAELKLGRPADALRTAESIPGAQGPGELITAAHPRGQALRALALDAARAGRVDQALMLADAFHDDDETRMGIAAIVLESGRKDETRRIVDRLQKTPKFPGGPGRDQRMAVLEYRLGNPGPYRRRVAGFEARARQEGPRRDEAKVGLMALHLGVGKVDEAREAVAGVQSRAFDFLVGYFALEPMARGDLDGVERLGSLLTEPAGRGPFLAGLAVARLRRDGGVEAARWAGRLATPEDRAAAFLGLADSF